MEKLNKRIYMNFIDHHLISKIIELYKFKLKVLENESNFLYFDFPIKTNIYKIDRIGKGCVYFENQVLPLDWNSISGKTLLLIFNEIKNNNVYIYREIDGRFFKTRLRRERC